MHIVNIFTKNKVKTFTTHVSLELCCEIEQYCRENNFRLQFKSNCWVLYGSGHPLESCSSSTSGSDVLIRTMLRSLSDLLPRNASLVVWLFVCNCRLSEGTVTVLFPVLQAGINGRFPKGSHTFCVFHV